MSDAAVRWPCGPWVMGSTAGEPWCAVGILLVCYFRYRHPGGGGAWEKESLRAVSGHVVAAPHHQKPIWCLDYLGHVRRRGQHSHTSERRSRRCTRCRPSCKVIDSSPGHDRRDLAPIATRWAANPLRTAQSLLPWQPGNGCAGPRGIMARIFHSISENKEPQIGGGGARRVTGRASMCSTETKYRYEAPGVDPPHGTEDRIGRDAGASIECWARHEGHEGLRYLAR